MPGRRPTAICSGLPRHLLRTIIDRMGTKSRDRTYGSSVRAAAERAATGHNEIDELAGARDFRHPIRQYHNPRRSLSA